MHVLPNISKSKGNQTMKFCQLTEYDMRNIQLDKLFTKRVWWRNNPQTFFWITELSISLNLQSKLSTLYCYCVSSWGLSEHNETKRQQTTCFYLILKFKKKTKKQSKNRRGASLSVSFSQWFLNKSISLVIFY